MSGLCVHTEPKSLTARTADVLNSIEASFKALTLLNSEALRTNNSSAIGAISRGIAAHKVKVVSWTTKNRKLWRKKGKTAATAPSMDSLASSVFVEDKTLGPKEIQQANELVDQLKKLLSQ